MTDDVARWHQAPTVLSRNLPDGIMLLSAVRDDDPIAVTGPGGEIWSALAEPHHLDELLEILATQYRVDGEDIREDVTAVLDDLLGRGLVERDLSTSDPITTGSAAAPGPPPGS